MDEETTTTETTTEKSLGERVMAFAGDPNAQFRVTSDADAAAGEAEAEDADSQGNQGEDTGTDGLDTTSQDGQGADSGKEEGEATDDLTSQETEGTEEEKTGLQQKTKEERIEELIEKGIEKRLAELNANRKDDTPDFAGPDVVKRVKLNILKWEDEIDDLKADIKLEGADADETKIDKLLALQDTVVAARTALKDNDAKKKAWEDRQKAKTDQTAVVNARLADLDKAADFFREAKGIDKPTWDKMGEYFANKCTSDKTLGAEFAEKAEREGPVAAVRWAHKYVTENMGKDVTQSNEKREQSKTTTAAVTASTSTKQTPVSIEKYRKAYAENPGPDTFAALQEAKRQAAAK